jgi:hypothetical protein
MGSATGSADLIWRATAPAMRGSSQANAHASSVTPISRPWLATSASSSETSQASSSSSIATTPSASVTLDDYWRGVIIGLEAQQRQGRCARIDARELGARRHLRPPPGGALARPTDHVEPAHAEEPVSMNER